MMQHQYWVTKKTVLKKLGTKEDECIVSSDAELDAKLELFRSISDSCLQLQRVLDQYQDRLCTLAQEENSLGKFLRDAGKTEDASGKHMAAAGKSISYSGQQRLSIRGPLLRLYHEVETFRGRAVSDMRSTIQAMEKARTEYRAALSWMKSTSAQLDPDTGRGLDNFRKAQRQVRESKKLFDKLSIDVLEKIDLLAAARCNMFSHVLTAYQTAFLTFSTKVSETFVSTAETMKSNPQYEFSILKELSQQLGEPESANKEELVPQDEDQMLFFKDEYKDSDNQKKEDEATIDVKSEVHSNKQSDTNTEMEDQTLIPANDLVDVTSTPASASCSDGLIADLAGLNFTGEPSKPFMPSQLLQGLNTSLLSSSGQNEEQASASKQTPQKPQNKKEDIAAWFKLFAELDPLANPDSVLGLNAEQNQAI